MSDKLTTTESALAGRLGKLRDSAARPRVEGLGMIGDALNFVSARAPLQVIRIALVLFLAYHAWDYFARAQQMVPLVESKQAEAATRRATAEAVNKKIGNDSAELAKLKAQLAKLQADAATAKADYEANATVISGVTARLATLRAEIQNTREEARKAQYELDAQNQTFKGLPVVIAQKRAEVEALEGEARQKVASARLLLGTTSNNSVDGSFGAVLQRTMRPGGYEQ